MTTPIVVQGSRSDLPPAMRSAQDAIRLPEVQAMLRRLSDFQLGVFMPHHHDEQTGDFRSLPDDIIQVESGLHVSFHPADAIARQAARFLPVGWMWRAGAVASVAACEMVCDENPGDAARVVKHKM